MVVARDATPFAKNVQGVTNITRVKTELALAVQQAPPSFRLATISTKDCILKAIASMDLVSHEVTQVSPYSLYYVSESFAGTSAAHDGMLITRTERALTQCIKALMGIDASYFGISAVPTQYLLSWYNFFNEHGPVLSQIRDNCPAHRDIYAELEHEIDSVHSQIARTARFSQPQYDVVDEAKRTQSALISGRLPTLKPLPSLILDKVRNVSPQESAELMSFLRPIAPPNLNQGYGSHRYNDHPGGREREHHGPNRGANNYYGPQGGNSGSGDRVNHPQDLITSNRDFQLLLAFGPRNDVTPPLGPHQENGRNRWECLNHVYLRNGCSLPNCPQRCNHTPIVAGSDCHRRCLNYRNHVLELASRAGARDFR